MVKTFQTVEPIAPAIPFNRLEEHVEQQMPTAPREIPFKIMDAEGKDLETFESITSIFRSRQRTTNTAFTVTDLKGKESATVTWEKLLLRAEKVAVSLKHLQAGERVGLYYSRIDIDFVVAFMGCFMAGVVAVPITTEDHAEIWFILRVAQIKLVLTNDIQHKALGKTLKSKHLDWPKDVDWCQTQSMGSAKALTHGRTTPLAYIEFSKSSTGELKGVSVTHQSVLKTCHTLAGATTLTVSTMAEDGSVSIVPHFDSQGADTILTYLDPRQQLGLSFLLLSIYTGSHTLLAAPSIVEMPAAWIYLCSKYEVNIALATYPGMQFITTYYSQHNKEVNGFSKKVVPNLLPLRMLLIDSLVVQPETDRLILNQLLTPLGQSSDIVVPVASLPEHAGLIIAFRDTLQPADSWTCTLDPDNLRLGKVVLSTEGLEVGSHGFPMASVAIVDSESHLLCLPNRVGEVWIDAPVLREGFWGIPALTDAVFRASPVTVSSDLFIDHLNPFIRTGQLGALVEGRLVLLGPYEECIRQQRADEPLGVEEIHMQRDLRASLAKQSECTFFNIYVNHQYLPILVLESSGQDLERKIEQATTTLLAFHGLRIYSTLVVQKGHLPRIHKNGTSVIHHLETKRLFLAGQLSILHLQMDVDRTVFHEAMGTGAFWHHFSAYERALSLQLISPRGRAQHSGIEMIQNTVDERSNYDLSRFTNIVDIILWRTSLYPDEVAFAVMSGNATKPVTWKKFNYQISGLAHHLSKKCKNEKRVLLFIPFGLDLIRTIYACFVLGIVPVVCSEGERVVPMLEYTGITHLLTSSLSEEVTKTKPFQVSTKRIRGFTELNIERASKFNKLLGPESGYSVRSEWTSDKSRPAMISEGDLVYGHDTILAQCRTQKLTCQIKYQKPLIVTGMGGSEGLGLLQAAFCGVYVGCTTMLIPLAEFRQDPYIYFELIAKNKCSTVCANYKLLERAMQRIPPSEQKSITLKATQNFMLTVPCRTKPRYYEKITRFLALSGLEKESINTVYSHRLNPMITTRSYMMMEPIPLLADIEWLRQGIIRPLVQEEHGVLLHDSGIVPTNTMVAIVNPETHTICPSHMIGEIWVSSDSNIKGADSVVQGGDTRIKYMRTGDLGFLWDVHRQGTGQVEEGQCLYVLGSLDEVIMSKGLIHFALDLEETVETFTSNIVTDGCYVVQADTEIVVIVAVRSTEAGLSVIPLVVSSILERHALLVDTVVTVGRDQLPKTLGDKKRRKEALSMYTNKKLSAIHVSRIKNQHQPIYLPKTNHILDDNASLLSFNPMEETSSVY
ncbi:hypothetical protein BY458DRAFT_443701 [Sporodiniella umbellata]|nr:hypothetical protein BY458DRAFT_443701 [Sporodiniella umbellata]